MPRMRSAKLKLKESLTGPHWRDHLDAISQGGMENVGPLFSFLLLGPQTMHRAAVALGQVTARLAVSQPEAARNIIRRLMWHLNEESGNIGWGIPEAFGEILAASAPLAKDFHKILLTYIIDLGHDDNFCDHDVLRRSCYWAIGRLAQARPDLCLTARPWLRKGLADQDVVCRGMAAWALAQLPAGPYGRPGPAHPGPGRAHGSLPAFRRQRRLRGKRHPTGPGGLARLASPSAVKI